MFLSWAVLLLAAIAAGGAACASLVARRGPGSSLALLSGLLAALLLYCIVAIARSTGRVDTTVAAGFIAFGALLGGFSLAAALVPSLTALPRVRAGAAPGDPAPPSLIVVADGHPEGYDPAVTTQSFERLADSGVPLPPDAIRVFAYLNDRGRHRSTGINPSRPVVRAVTRRATELLRTAGFTGEVREAWLHGTPRLCDALIDAAEQGSQEAAVVLLGVAESYEHHLARGEVDACADKGIPGSVVYAPPLWSDDALARFVCDRTLAALPSSPGEHDGVVLVAAGQPAQWDRTHPRAAEHETFFCQRVRSLLVTAGLQDGNVRTAWMDWHDPDVTEVVRHLAALGCARIVVVPATTAADSLETILDLPAAVAQAAVDASVHVEVLHGWGEDEAVSEVLMRASLAALRELEEPRGDRDQ